MTENRTKDENLKVGFHGDMNLIEVIKKCMGRSDLFVETGTNIGRSINYISQLFPSKKHVSCEVDHDKFEKAQEKCSSFKNVYLRNEKSVQTLKFVFESFDSEKITYWLDAHWSDSLNRDWVSKDGKFTREEANQPLKNELKVITGHKRDSRIFIDDIKVPDSSWFSYDSYGEVPCSFEEIKSSIKWDNYTVFYPDYEKDFDEMYHPPRGWALLCKKKDNIINFLKTNYSSILKFTDIKDEE